MSDPPQTIANSITVGPASSPYSTRQWVLVWLLFFLICFGLGYPVLGRYQSAGVEGLSDAAVYYQMVTGGRPTRPQANFEGRVLVPLLARPFYLIAKSRLPTWDPASFGLLIANSLFCATTALVLVHVGLVVTADAGTALLGATLYLLNFAIPNLQLAGLVDSGEACFMMLLAWALLGDRWWLLPLLGAAGALAKETFVPLAGVFALAWWLIGDRKQNRRVIGLGSVGALIATGSLTLTVVQWIIHDHLVPLWSMAAVMNSGSNYLVSFLGCIFDKGFWYVFIWLLPLGLWRWRALPRPWLAAALAAAGAALALGAYNNMGGNVARPVFNVAGPLLSLSVAMLLTRAPGQRFPPGSSQPIQEA